MRKLLLGIDIGTSSCKAAVFNLKGAVIGQSSKDYSVYYPAPDCVEQDPREWWEGVCNAIREILSTCNIKSEEITGIGVDGQSWSSIPVNKKGEVLYNTPIWMDTRSSEIAKRVVARVGADKILEISGNAFEPTYSTPKMLWFKETKPEIYNDTYMFLQSNSYIILKLTDKYTQDFSQGYGIHAFNMKTGKWEDGFCGELGISREKLPEIYQCHQVIGEVTGSAARETGLAAGTPVVAGGLDACCGTLGAGVIDIGQTQEQGGQAGGMSICLDQALAHPKLILSFHVVPDLWLLQGGTVGGGGCINWFKKELGGFEIEQGKKSGKDAFKIMDEEAAKISEGADGLIFLPYMAGERSPIWNKHAKGVFFGLGYNKTRAHIIRSILEGTAFALKHNLKTANEIGVNVEVLNAMGGAANSRLWTQIKSDVTGNTINVPASDTATTLGAAILAGVGIGVYKDFEEAVNKTIKISRVHKPDMEKNKIYNKYYEIYIELYEKLKGIMLKISQI
jgi:xylulokinase